MIFLEKWQSSQRSDVITLPRSNDNQISNALFRHLHGALIHNSLTMIVEIDVCHLLARYYVMPSLTCLVLVMVEWFMRLFDALALLSHDNNWLDYILLYESQVYFCFHIILGRIELALLDFPMRLMVRWVVKIDRFFRVRWVVTIERFLGACRPQPLAVPTLALSATTTTTTSATRTTRTRNDAYKNGIYKDTLESWERYQAPTRTTRHGSLYGVW